MESRLGPEPPCFAMGYPSLVELTDGRLLVAYYAAGGAAIRELASRTTAPWFQRGGGGAGDE